MSGKEKPSFIRNILSIKFLSAHLLTLSLIGNILTLSFTFYTINNNSTTINNLNTEIDDYKNVLVELNNTINKNDVTIKTLNIIMENQTNLINDYDQIIKNYEYRINQQNQTINEYELTIEYYEYQLSEEWRDEIIQNLTTLEMKFIDLNKEYTDYISQKSQELTNLIGDNIRLDSELETARIEINNLDNEIRDLGLEYITVTGLVEHGKFGTFYVRFISLDNAETHECEVINHYYSIELKNYDTYKITVRSLNIGQSTFSTRSESYFLSSDTEDFPLNLPLG